MIKNKNIFSLISAITASIYVLVFVVSLVITMTTDESTLIYFLLGLAVKSIVPIIITGVGAMFNWAAFFTDDDQFTFVATILYLASGIFSFKLMPFFIPVIILGIITFLVGYYAKKKK